MTTAIPFSTRLIGQTEKTLNAILDRMLSGTGVSEPQWVALTVVLNQGAASTAATEALIAATLKISRETGAELLASLIECGFVAIAGPDTVAASSTGHEFHGRIRLQIGEITSRVWGDIPVHELDAAAAVLNTTLQRATAELATLISDDSEGRAFPR